MDRRRILAALVGGLGLALAGCAAVPPVDTTGSIRSAEPTRAFVLPPPGAHAVLSVVERRYANATEQQVILSSDAVTAGQNGFRVQLFGPGDWVEAGQTALPAGNFGPAEVASLIRTAMPGVRMTVSPYYVQNRYGPFGYAMGRGTGADLCLFAWQRIASKPGFLGNQGALRITLRLCRAGATEADLLETMYGFTVNAFIRNQAWNPYGSARAAPGYLGENGSPVLPLGADRFVNVAPPAPVAPPVRTAPRRAGPAAPAEPKVIPSPIGPYVPPPPASTPSSLVPASLKTSAPVSVPAVVVPPPPVATAGPKTGFAPVPPPPPTTGSDR